MFTVQFQVITYNSAKKPCCEYLRNLYLHNFHDCLSPFLNNRITRQCKRQIITGVEGSSHGLLSDTLQFSPGRTDENLVKQESSPPGWEQNTGLPEYEAPVTAGHRRSIHYSSESHSDLSLVPWGFARKQSNVALTAYAPNIIEVTVTVLCTFQKHIKAKGKVVPVLN
jgi:hypothetical protein